MLMYVIPLIILIVVLLILKKRQDAQESNQPPKKGNANSKVKKTNSTRTQKKPVKVAKTDTSAVEVKEVQHISSETRKKIELLIQDRNFFAAEAQINQALKNNNTQHELYLLLLDIHILQKDDFAINQLLSHINALELHDIAEQAHTKISHEKASDKDSDLIQFHSSQPEPVQHNAKQVSSDNVSSDAFDALMSASSTTQKPNIPEASIEDIQLEFSTPIVTETQEKVEISDKNTILEFNPSFTTSETQLQVEEKTISEEIKPLDFSFTLSTPNEVIEEKTSQYTEVAKDEYIKENEFNLDFISHKTPDIESETPSITLNDQSEFSFSLDTKPSIEVEETVIAEIELHSNLNASFIEEVTPTPVSTEAPITAASDLDLSDPLIQAFPALLTVNEAQLNLELAQKYIELGAYEAARSILAEKEVDYSAEQHQLADQLLNQIAS